MSARILKIAQGDEKKISTWAARRVFIRRFIKKNGTKPVVPVSWIENFNQHEAA